MVKIEFKAAYGDQVKHVELTNHSGAGSSFHLYIDRFYSGMIMIQQGKWTVHLNPEADEELTTEDRSILVDIVNDHLPD